MNPPNWQQWLRPLFQRQMLKGYCKVQSLLRWAISSGGGCNWDPNSSDHNAQFHFACLDKKSPQQHHFIFDFVPIQQVFVVPKPWVSCQVWIWLIFIVIFYGNFKLSAQLKFSKKKRYFHIYICEWKKFFVNESSKTKSYKIWIKNPQYLHKISKFNIFWIIKLNFGWLFYFIQSCERDYIKRQSCSVDKFGRKLENLWDFYGFLRLISSD